MDARLPERLLTDPVLDALSDAAFRMWVTALAYSVGQATDGHITARGLRLLHPNGSRPDLARELVDRGVWRPDGDGWINVRHQDAQTSAEDLERLRGQNRQRSADYRARRRASRSKKPDEDRHASSRVTGSGANKAEQPSTSRDGSRDDHVTRVGEARQGKARQGSTTRTNPYEAGSELWPELRLCAVCGTPMHAALAELEGWTTHPACQAA